MYPAVIVIAVLLGSSIQVGASKAGAGAGSPWEAQVGGFTRIADLDALSPSEVWAVGSSVVLYDGVHWRSIDRSVTAADYRGIDMVTSGTGWVVGAGEAIPIVDSVIGTAVIIPETSLNDIVLHDADNGWAVGLNAGNGVIYRLESGRWSLVFEVEDSPLYSVWSPNPRLAWAVGERGTALQFNGTSWRQSPRVVEDTLFTIGGSSGDAIWAGGGRPGDPFGAGKQGVLTHFDGSEWRVVHRFESDTVRDIDIDGDVGYAVGDFGRLLMLSSGDWEELPQRIPATGYQRVRAIVSAGDSGQLWVGGDDGVVHQVDGGGTISWAHPPTALTGIAFGGDNLGWAVDGNEAMRYSHGVWLSEAVESRLNQMLDIDAISSSMAWAVGSTGTILRWNGSVWSETESPTKQTLSRVRAVTSNLAWASGSTRIGDLWQSTLLQFDGVEWKVVWHRAGGREVQINDIDGVSPDAGWVAGPYGVWRHGSDGWSHIRFGYTEEHSSVATAADKSVWYARRGSIYYWNGECWRDQFHLNAGISRISLEPDGTGWAVAAGGYVLRLHGGQWSVLRGPQDTLADTVPVVLFDVTATDSGDEANVWAVGSNHTILRAPIASVDKVVPVKLDPTPRVPEIPRTPTPEPLSDGSIPATMCKLESSAFLPYGSRH